MLNTESFHVGLTAIGDPDDPGLWSGTPHNIVRALRDLGVAVVPIDATPPFSKRMVDAIALPHVLTRAQRDGLDRSIHAGRRSAQESIPLAWARGLVGRSRLRAARPLDGVVQIGTGYRLSHPNVVSYEDMTVPQAIRYAPQLWGDVSGGRRQFRTRQQSRAYRRLAGATFSSQWAADSAIVEQGCPRQLTHAIGIGPNFVAARGNDRDWHTPRFLFAGREWDRKNGARVVTAFAAVRAQYPAAELHLAGDHPRIDLDGVTGHGYLSLRDNAARATMAHLWSTATCCVAPSIFEPAGIIYVEAMHAGIPSIGTTQGGAADIIGDAGSVVDPTDENALVAAMAAYCEPAVAAAAGEAATARSAQYTWRVVARRLLDALGLATNGITTLR